MTDRGPVSRCVVRACPFVGHFAAYDGRCPQHREDERIFAFLTPEPDDIEGR